MPQKIDKSFIRDLAELLNETDLSEIEVEQEGLRIKVARNITINATTAPVSYAPAAAPAAPVAAAAPAEAAAPAPASDANHPGVVTSPMVGTAYYASEPGAKPFVTAGQTVKQGETLLLIEAMKTFNPITAAKSGKVTKIIVGDGQPVEYGEPLLIIE